MSIHVANGDQRIGGSPEVHDSTGAKGLEYDTFHNKHVEREKLNARFYHHSLQAVIYFMLRRGGRIE